MAQGGVIGMLEVILSDFQRLQAAIEATEVHAQKKYDQFMDDPAIVQGESNEKSFQDDMIAQSYDGKGDRIQQTDPERSAAGEGGGTRAVWMETDTPAPQ